MSKTIFKKRAFLNTDTAMSGFIVAVLDEFDYHEDTDRVSAYPTLDLGDCSNKISLDFSFYNTTQMRRAQKKLKILKDAINGFSDAFDAEVNRFDTTKPKIKRKPKKKKRIVNVTST